eukprot:scaffold112650_cov36-Tisochrysis_lutea.AAC.1
MVLMRSGAVRTLSVGACAGGDVRIPFTCAETVGVIGPIAFCSASAATIDGDQRPPLRMESKNGMSNYTARVVREVEGQLVPHSWRRRGAVRLQRWIALIRLLNGPGPNPRGSCGLRGLCRGDGSRRAFAGRAYLHGAGVEATESVACLSSGLPHLFSSRESGA